MHTKIIVHSTGAGGIKMAGTRAPKFLTAGARGTTRCSILSKRVHIAYIQTFSALDVAIFVAFCTQMALQNSERKTLDGGVKHVE